MDSLTLLEALDQFSTKELDDMQQLSNAELRAKVGLDDEWLNSQKNVMRRAGLINNLLARIGDD